ncbi:MAG: anaerobic glycerol-3-phosphate dehydrogenase subunit A [Desulfofustis sp.]|nr:anaerobic glycerol-3-phosphate dehydrogenase subunit A [Desulfofustis sp.]
MVTSPSPCTATVHDTAATDVLIVGGGMTGAGIMRDLALRGIHSMLIDRRDLCAGASGGNHGLLHSGARYVSNDRESAIQCRQENALLRRLARRCIEPTDGLFVAVDGDDPDFATAFPQWCSAAGITCESVAPSEARRLEPHLSERIIAAYRVDDATVDPFRLALQQVAHATSLAGSTYRPHTDLIAFEHQDDRLSSAICRDNRTGSLLRIRARQFVNAGGAWAGRIALLAGCPDVHLLYSKGTLLISHDRLTSHVINRLRLPADGDILVPGGTVSVLGTTSVRIDDPDLAAPTVAEVDRNISEGAMMLPVLATTRYLRAFSRVRPLLPAGGDGDDRHAVRGFALYDHQGDGLTNFCTITGGKLTTFRLMAQQAADLVAARLGNTSPGRTDTIPLPEDDSCRWTEPGAAPRYWHLAGDRDDLVLCECEMVPQSAIDEIVRCAPGAEKEMTLEAIALRSRAGKGPCQGSFCGIRIASYLYDRGHYRDRTGLQHLRDFFNERFKGMRTVIRGPQAAQMELAEALHCGVLGLDALDDENVSDPLPQQLETGATDD